jgi:hypothetical protein
MGCNERKLVSNQEIVSKPLDETTTGTVRMTRQLNLRGATTGKLNDMKISRISVIAITRFASGVGVLFGSLGDLVHLFEQVDDLHAALGRRVVMKTQHGRGLEHHAFHHL